MIDRIAALAGAGRKGAARTAAGELWLSARKAAAGEIDAALAGEYVPPPVRRAIDGLRAANGEDPVPRPARDDQDAGIAASQPAAPFTVSLAYAHLRGLAARLATFGMASADWYRVAGQSDFISYQLWDLGRAEQAASMLPLLEKLARDRDIGAFTTDAGTLLYPVQGPAPAGRTVHVPADSANGRAVEHAQARAEFWRDAGYAIAPVPDDGWEHPLDEPCPACAAAGRQAPAITPPGETCDHGGPGMALVLKGTCSQCGTDVFRGFGSGQAMRDELTRRGVPFSPYPRLGELAALLDLSAHQAVQDGFAEIPPPGIPSSGRKPFTAADEALLTQLTQPDRLTPEQEELLRVFTEGRRPEGPS